ncbi:methyltransferase-like protein 25 [Fopius arisanus]|uniref:Methyltransferase-like protein 25 n=1 Tax=Fopius arisanus TaxID=64838 RepID=A0A9R1TQQ5_9HYME|nr:PREDICTED: methyltransferase-like protein 25 [Fopius arisanus]
MKTFQEDLEDNLSFIQEHENVINSHLVNFITEDLWEKLPSDLQVELQQFEGEMDFLLLVKRCPALKLMIDRAETLSLKSNPKVLDLEDFSVEFLNDTLNSEERNSLKDIQNDFMKDKKRYEISNFAKVIACLANGNKCLVIDAGGGKGYLATHLSNKYSIPVLSLDSNPRRNKSAINRQKVLEKTKNQTFPLSQHSVEFIHDSTNFSELVKSYFPDWRGEDYLLTGLHTCGPLAHSIIKTFTRSETLKILCVVSCCYHLTEEFLTTDVNFSKTMRMLAQQSVERISAKNAEQPISIFYRSLLQLLLKNLKIPDVKIGRGAPTEDFQTYVTWSLTKIGLPPDQIPSEKDLIDLQMKYSNYRWKLNIFQTIRAHMGSVIESSIILDRFIYLQQSEKCSKLSIVRVFDPLLSPRCFAIIALK